MTFTDVNETGYYTFENRIGKTVRFACVWATTSSKYQPPFVYSWSSKVGAHRERGYGDYHPRDVDCAAGRTWPTLPILSFTDATAEFGDSSLEVFWYAACAEREADDCANTVVFVNRVHEPTSFECSWTTGCGVTSVSNSGDLDPYFLGYYGPATLPDPGSVTCSVNA